MSRTPAYGRPRPSIKMLRNIMAPALGGSGTDTQNDESTTFVEANVVSPAPSSASNDDAPKKKFVSFRSRFEHMRSTQQFSNPADDPPCDKSEHSFRSLKGDEAMQFMKLGIQQRKNNLAKQILSRRKNHVQIASRTGFDP